MWDYRAEMLTVVDGDTVRLLVDTGFYQRCEIELRLLDVWAPERADLGGAETKDFVSRWFAELAHRGERRWPWHVFTKTTKTAEPTETRSFTRWIGTVASLATGDILNHDVQAFIDEHPEWGMGVT